jgi:hypothetical protein
MSEKLAESIIPAAMALENPNHTSDTWKRWCKIVLILCGTSTCNNDADPQHTMSTQGRDERSTPGEGNCANSSRSCL